jgi:hypothetical protein
MHNYVLAIGGSQQAATNQYFNTYWNCMSDEDGESRFEVDLN